MTYLHRRESVSKRAPTSAMMKSNSVINNPFLDIKVENKEMIPSETTRFHFILWLFQLLFGICWNGNELLTDFHKCWFKNIWCVTSLTPFISHHKFSETNEITSSFNFWRWKRNFLLPRSQAHWLACTVDTSSWRLPWDWIRHSDGHISNRCRLL